MPRITPGVTASFIFAVLACNLSCTDTKRPMTEDDPSSGKRRIEIGDYYLAPGSESAARATAVLPTEGSEDASHILAPLDIPDDPERDSGEYLPKASAEWIVHANLLDPNKLAAKDVAALFGQDWRSQHGGVTIYGKRFRRWFRNWSLRDSGLAAMMFCDSLGDDRINVYQLSWKPSCVIATPQNQVVGFGNDDEFFLLFHRGLRRIANNRPKGRLPK